MDWNILRRLSKQIIIKSRKLSSKPRPVVILNEETRKSIEDGTLKPRRHPGVSRIPPVKLPEEIRNNIKLVIGDVPFKNIVEDAKSFHNYLWSRHIPPESDVVDEVIDEYRKKLKLDEVLNEETTEDPLGNKNIGDKYDKRKKKVMSMVKSRIYNWKPLEYNTYKGLQYLVQRSPAEYSVLMTILNEIARREPEFQPTSLFDFGSGVGTVTWAVLQHFRKSLNEVFTVDASGEMNDLARTILAGNEVDPVPIPKFFQRQFLPQTPMPFDLVVCSYTLFELPSMKARLETIINLWRKTKEFLVIVEMGTNAGFHLIEEARAFILDQKDDGLIGHVFAPCPHELSCPRLTTDNTPCNFINCHIGYSHEKREDIKPELFSYVVLRKGPRAQPDAWPRIVRPPISKSKHAVCRMCTSEGKLKEIIFTAKKHDKTVYRCARSSNWGDLLPIDITNIESEDVKPEDDVLIEPPN